MDVVRGSALVAALCLLVPGLASAQADAYYQVDGVEYHTAVGGVHSGNLSLGPDHDRTQGMAFQGCADATLRDDVDHGRIRVSSKVHGVPFGVEASTFEEPHADVQGGIARDMMVDGSHSHGSIQHPAVHATVAAWGQAGIEVMDLPFHDPVTGEASFNFSYFVTATGFRDDETGRVRNPDGSAYQPGDRAVRERGDWEMHLRLVSPQGAPQPDETLQFQEPPDVGFTRGYFPPQEEHSKVFWVPNLRFGGNATVELAASALPWAGDNDLTFTLRDPDGVVVAEAAAQPGFGQPFSESFGFPLDRFGLYSIVVQGQVSLSEYSIRMVQQTPERFDLSLWWEDLAFGSRAPAVKQACNDIMSGSNEALSGSVVGRPPPPSFPWTSVVMTALGITAALLVSVKMLMMSRAAAAHRRALRD